MAGTIDLNEMMQFDHVVHVHDDGTVTDDVKGVWAPDLYTTTGKHTSETDSELKLQARVAGWELETGWTGQYLYSGPRMHASEYVGGALARYILETPGYWVVTAVYEEGDDPDSWAIAHREA